MALKELRTPKFEPQFLYIDEENIKNQKEKLLENAEEINSILTFDFTSLFEEPLTDEECIELLKRRMVFVYEKLQFECPIPNVKIEKYIELKGIEKSIKKFAGLFFRKGNWQLEKYNIKNKTATVKEGFYESLKEENTYYTTHQKQNDYLSIANELADALNKVFDNKMLYVDEEYYGMNTTSISSYIKTLSKLLDTDKKKVIPNYREIRLLQEPESK